MAVAVVFPGQGAQAQGLGVPWADEPAWALVAEAEEAAGAPLARLLLDAPPEELSRTREAQLVVFLASLLAWQVTAADLERRGEPVVAFAGHSLGQMTALVAAGALPLAEGCRLAVRRAEHTQAAADARSGRLAALLGATADQAEEACGVAPEACWVANDNGPGQVVIGGTPEGVEAASAKAKDLGVKRVMPLNVGGAFHTPLMQPAADAFAADLATATFSDIAVPVVSNTDARPYTDAGGWPGRLSEQLIRPVRWAETMPALTALGATAVVEVGPGSTLTGLAKRALPGVTLRNVAVPDDLLLESAHA